MHNYKRRDNWRGEGIGDCKGLLEGRWEGMVGPSITPGQARRNTLSFEGQNLEGGTFVGDHRRGCGRGIPPPPSHGRDNFKN